MIPLMIDAIKARTNKNLLKYLPIPKTELSDAMHYSVLNGGKRIRPSLVYLFGNLFDIPLERLDSVASAVELIHTYSLIHDDLPAMDNDALRRGKASCHIQFNEATAILTGDALQSLAFEIIAYDASLSFEKRLSAIQLLSSSIGVTGMCQGQSFDLGIDPSRLRLSDLKEIYYYKTGCLIEASCLLGASFGTSDTTILRKIEIFAQQLGSFFQIQDDLLDRTESTCTLGKPQKSDKKNGKKTYFDFYEIDALKALLDHQYDTCLTLLNSLTGDLKPLINFVDYIFKRRS